MYLQEVQSVVSTTPIRNTWDAGRLLQEQFTDADREYFVSVNLDAQGRPISYHVAGIGSICAVHFAIANVFKVALLQNAASIIVCHNHPGGTAKPSTEDIEATEILVDVGDKLGIKVLDHFILTPYDYISLREERGDLFR
jgi:DNA repair protein RadC